MSLITILNNLSPVTTRLINQNFKQKNISQAIQSRRSENYVPQVIPDGLRPCHRTGTISCPVGSKLRLYGRHWDDGCFLRCFSGCVRKERYRCLVPDTELIQYSVDAHGCPLYDCSAPPRKSNLSWETLGWTSIWNKRYDTRKFGLMASDQSTNLPNWLTNWWFCLQHSMGVS